MDTLPIGLRSERLQYHLQGALDQYAQVWTALFTQTTDMRPTHRIQEHGAQFDAEQVIWFDHEMSLAKNQHGLEVSLISSHRVYWVLFLQVTLHFAVLSHVDDHSHAQINHVCDQLATHLLPAVLSKHITHFRMVE